MRILATLLATIFAMVFAASVHAVSVKTKTLQDAVTANGGGVEEPTTGFTTVVVQVCCTFDATVNFEWSVDGDNFEPLECVSLADRNNRSTSVIAQGGMRCNLIGVNKFRARVSSYVSGSVTATGGFASAGVF